MEGGASRPSYPIRTMKNRIIRLRDPFRTGKAYTVEQAAAITATSPANVRRWLTGYEAPGHRMDPVLGGRGGSDGPLIVSFLELAELIVVVGFRKAGVRLQRLRDAHEYAREAFDLAYPFASLKLQRAGGHVLHEFEQISPGVALTT